MKPALALLLLGALLLAGCGSSSDGTDSTTSSGASGTSGATTDGPTSTSHSGTGTVTGNKAPTLTFSASVAAGNAPLAVNFTLDARDPEGKPVTWSVSYGDNSTAATGSSLPTTLAHTFTNPGNYTVKATVSDGEKEANRTLPPIKVTAVGAKGPSQSATVTWQNGAFGCGASYPKASPGAPAAGVLYGELAVDAATYGLPFTADFGSLGGSLFAGLDFYDADGAQLDGGDSAFEDPPIVTGIVPADAAIVQFFNCGASGGSVNYVAGTP